MIKLWHKNFDSRFSCLQTLKIAFKMLNKQFLVIELLTIFATIILYEVDQLSTDALVYIRWLLERNKGCNKFFFCCSDVSKLQPIKSVCTVVQLLQPTNKEVTFIIKVLMVNCHC